MKFVVYRNSDGAIKRVHPIKDMPDNEIAKAVEKNNADPAKDKIEIADAEENSLIVYLWRAFDEKVKSLLNEIQEAEDAADELSRMLYNLREAAGGNG